LNGEAHQLFSTMFAVSRDGPFREQGVAGSNPATPDQTKQRLSSRLPTVDALTDDSPDILKNNPRVR
jgi:hypothetical protein